MEAGLMKETLSCRPRSWIDETILY